jgi:transcriptional regulator with XRE-family HTH domain
MAKLTEDDVRMIIELNEERMLLRKKLNGLSQKAIADKFGVSQQRICEIVNQSRGAWSHV